MKKFPTTIAVYGLGLLLALSGCATRNPPADTGASALQRMEAGMGRATPSLKVSIQSIAKQTQAGDVATVRVSSNTSGFVYLLHLDGDGRTLRLVFPNAMDDANFMGSGYLDLPRGNWRMPARSPNSVAHLMAIVSPTQMDLEALQAQLAYGKFELMGAYGAAMIPLR